MDVTLLASVNNVFDKRFYTSGWIGVADRIITKSDFYWRAALLQR
jgi:outer membrane receptor protein involved in Fe transport